MNEIKVAENKTLKLTNVLSREIRPEEMASLPVVLTQMHNFIKSNNAQPIGPIIQSFALGEDHQMHLYMMQQATQLIPQMDPGYHMDAILRVKNCLYAHYTGPMENSQLASYKLQVHAFENEQKLTGTSYTIYVNQDEYVLSNIVYDLGSQILAQDVEKIAYFGLDTEEPVYEGEKK